MLKFYWLLIGEQRKFCPSFFFADNAPYILIYGGTGVMWEIIRDALPSLLGGLALFIFGMNFMGEGLQKAAGERLRHILKILTTNPFMGILVGMIVTTIIQSSSATTVMVVGFVSAGLMNLRQAIGVIMGANIGTTVTAWLVSIKLNEFTYHILAIGFVIYFFSKNQRIRFVGQVFFGFGMLFTGLNIMSDAMKPLAGSIEIQNLMASVSENRILGLVIGTLVTAIVQSSSAVIAVIQKLAVVTTPEGLPLITLTAAIPLVLGSNIGTTITAVLASIGASLNAKRAALVHVLFNLFGSIIFIFFVPQEAWIIRQIMGGGEIPAASMDVAIANFHTFFNVVNAIIFLPMISLLEKAVCAIYKGEEPVFESSLSNIDPKVFRTPSIAMNLAVNELKQMSKYVQTMVQKAKESIIRRDASAAEETFRLEDIVDSMKRKVVDFLAKILSKSLTPGQSVRLTGLMRIAHDIEKVGDHCKDISEISMNMINSKISFSDSALAEIEDAFGHIEKIISEMRRAFEEGDLQAAKNVVQLEAQFDEREKNLRERHIERLNRGECKPTSAISFLELIHYIERITDNCRNVAESVLDDLSHKLYSDLEQKQIAAGKQA